MGPDRQGEKHARRHETCRAPTSPARNREAGSCSGDVGDHRRIRVVGSPSCDHHGRAEQDNDRQRPGGDAVQESQQHVRGHNGDQSKQVAGCEEAPDGAEPEVEEARDNEESHLGSFSQSRRRIQSGRIADEHLAWFNDVDRVHARIRQIDRRHAPDPQHHVGEDWGKGDRTGFAHARPATMLATVPRRATDEGRLCRSSRRSRALDDPTKH